MVSAPDRNAVCPPSAASSTALPVPAQLVRAAWMRAVSGGAASAAGSNVRSVVDSVAGRRTQVAGTTGWVTVRVSPVASWAVMAGATVVAAAAPVMAAGVMVAPVR